MITKWNLKLLYKSETDPQIQKDIDLATKNVHTFVKKWKINKEYTKDPAVLAKALDEYEKLQATTGICEKPIYYFMLRNYLDQSNPDIKARLNQIDELYTKLENEIQFFSLTISRIPSSKQKSFLEYEGLKPYKHHLEQEFLISKYLLSEKEENVFSLTSKTSHSNWKKMLTELLNKQKATVLNEELKEIEISYNDITQYHHSLNKKVRDVAAKEFNRINSKYAEIAEFEINSILETKKITDDYRKLPRADLATHIADDIDSEVVDTLVKTVTDNFNISREYYAKKAKLLGLKKLGYYERNIPLQGANQKYTFEQSKNLVEKVFNNLDPFFGQTINQYFQNGQYDVSPEKGKSGGAFCISVNKNLPTYMLLNFQNQLGDVLTMAHESGHGIHAELSNEKQNAINCGHPISLAEVASTFFEGFVLEEILRTTTDQTVKQAILDMNMNENASTIFRQVAFYNFETELHHDFREKGFLTKEYISDLFCKHMKSYLGDTVEEDEGMRNGWIYISHFRRFFYVYSYASGLLISKALQKMVKDDKKNIVYVKRFLESGSTQSPKELFKDIGIDITKKEFWENGIEEIKTLLNKL
jgi:oligoendopeptidase F